MYSRRPFLMLEVGCEKPSVWLLLLKQNKLCMNFCQCKVQWALDICRRSGPGHPTDTKSSRCWCLQGERQGRGAAITHIRATLGPPEAMPSSGPFHRHTRRPYSASTGGGFHSCQICRYKEPTVLAQYILINTIKHNDMWHNNENIITIYFTYLPPTYVSKPVSKLASNRLKGNKYLLERFVYHPSGWNLSDCLHSI